MNGYPIINLPASKSIGARYLVASYFANTLGACPRFNDCDDLKVIQKALLDLTINEEWLGIGSPAIDLHASGTAFRFMTAVVASTPCADFIIKGTPRLCSRPMTPLLEVLRQAGASIEALGENGAGPYRIIGRRLKGGDFSIRGDVSSQFISALMLVAPTWSGGMRLRFTTPLVSRPYAEMTAKVMREFGIGVTLDDEGVTVKEGTYLAPRSFTVEADWSAAAFFYEAAFFQSRPVYIKGLVPPAESMQGDAETAALFLHLGLKSFYGESELPWVEPEPDITEVQKYYDMPDGIRGDMSHCPDLVPALAVACAFNGCRFHFSGVRNLRVKESDRLNALKTEIEKFGYPVTVGDDYIEWQGGAWSVDRNFVVDTYDDHRIAMAFAVAALRMGTMRIANPDVVEKSFAGFWQQLPKLGLTCTREGDVMVVKGEEDEL